MGASVLLVTVTESLRLPPGSRLYTKNDRWLAPSPAVGKTENWPLSAAPAGPVMSSVTARSTARAEAVQSVRVVRDAVMNSLGSGTGSGGGAEAPPPIREAFRLGQASRKLMVPV